MGEVSRRQGEGEDEGRMFIPQAACSLPVVSFPLQKVTIPTRKPSPHSHPLPLETEQHFAPLKIKMDPGLLAITSASIRQDFCICYAHIFVNHPLIKLAEYLV